MTLAGGTVLAVVTFVLVAHGVYGCGDFNGFYEATYDTQTIKSINFDTGIVASDYDCEFQVIYTDPIIVWLHGVSVNGTSMSLSYTLPSESPTLVDLNELEDNEWAFRFTSFHGSTVNFRFHAQIDPNKQKLAISFVLRPEASKCSPTEPLLATSTPQSIHRYRYAENDICTWTIESSGDYVDFEATWVDLGTVEDPCGDIISITNEGGTTGDVAVLCGDREVDIINPTIYQSSGKRVIITFEANDDAIRGIGYAIIYTSRSIIFIPEECEIFEGSITAEAGKIQTIKSPHFDTGVVASDIVCQFELKHAGPYAFWIHGVSVSGNLMTLSYETPDKSPIFVNLNELDEHESAFRFTSLTGSTVKFQFQMKSTEDVQRLSISFMERPEESECSPTEPLLATSTPQLITRYRYDDNELCTWTIQSSGDYVGVEATWVAVGTVENPCDDKIYITNEGGLTGDVAVLCGERKVDIINPTIYSSSGERLIITFDSNNDGIDGVGYVLKYFSRSIPGTWEAHKICSYTPNNNEPGGTLEIDIVIRPGSIGLARVALVNESSHNIWTELDDECGVVDTLNAEGNMVISNTINVASSSPLTGEPDIDSCPFKVETIDDIEHVCYYALPRESLWVVLPGEEIQKACCNVKSSGQSTDTPTMSLVYQEYEVNKMIASNVLLEFVYSYSLSTITEPIYVGEPLQIKFTMKEDSWNGDADFPWGAHLYYCTSRGFPNTAPHVDQRLFMLTDENGCVVVNDLKTDLIFMPETSYPNYKADYTGGSGINYVATTAIFDAFKYTLSDVIYVDCYYRYCYDEACLNTPCITDRKKREASDKEEEVMVLTAAVVFGNEELVIIPYQVNETLTTERVPVDCFQSWVFIVVVVILVILLVLTILISIFLVHQVVKSKNPSKGNF